MSAIAPLAAPPIVPTATPSVAAVHELSVPPRQSCKFAAASAGKSAAPDLLLSEHRKLLPAEIQALCGCEFTLDAVATDSGDSAHCTEFCSPSNSFTSTVHTGRMWINAPFRQLTTFKQIFVTLFVLQTIVAWQYFCLYSGAWLLDAVAQTFAFWHDLPETLY